MLFSENNSYLPHTSLQRKMFMYSHFLHAIHSLKKKYIYTYQSPNSSTFREKEACYNLFFLSSKALSRQHLPQRCSQKFFSEDHFYSSCLTVHFIFCSFSVSFVFKTKSTQVCFWPGFQSLMLDDIFRTK